MTQKNANDDIELSFYHLRGRATGAGSIRTFGRLMALGIAASTLIALAGLAAYVWQ